MKTSIARATSRGFTFIELVITLALVGLLSVFAMPLYEVTATRTKESELREALRAIRAGIDAYKAATEAGLLARETGASGYPATLEKLTESLEVLGKRDLTNAIATQRMAILRRLPRDPFNMDPEVPAEMTWNVRSYASRPDDPEPGDDVFDVSSKSGRLALDGTPYSSW
jgi:general secretion pathway protein G